MRAAHQGLTPQPLPTSWGGSFIANAGSAGAAPGPSEQAALTPPASIGGSGASPARPAPTQVAQRPAQGSGMDGWLLDKLFGKR